MTSSPSNLDQRLDRISAQLERMATAIVQGFGTAKTEQDALRDELKQSIGIYARAVDAYAKQAETYMQEMLALGAKVERLEKQIEQIAAHLDIKLAY